MQETWLQSLQADPLQAVLSLFLLFIGYVLVGLVPASLALYLLYFLLTLPMRRYERARMFLDLLELGLRQGRTPEASIIAVAGSRDRSFGVRFYLLAEQLRAGERLSQALAAVPRLLPPQVTAMLGAGERTGDLSRIMPACRKVLKDSVSQVRGALNYVLVVLFAATPAMVLVPLFFAQRVLPKYKEVLSSMSGAPLPGFTRLVFGEYGTFATIQVAAILFLWIALLAFIGGPRLHRWFDRLAPGVADRLALLLPWRRKRAQRDFSAVLSLLLDAGLPETEAVRLAAEATANRWIARRAGRVTAALQQGVKLPEALALLDPNGELRWRVANAAHGRAGFVRALNGWHEALDARAFQLEQAAAQVTTTALVLLNGLIVGAIVVAVFLGLISLIQGAVLW